MYFTRPLRVPTLLAAFACFAASSPRCSSEVPHKESVKEAATGDAGAPRKNRKKSKRPVPKLPVAPADYARWESLRSEPGDLSANGRWLAYTVARVDKKQTVHLLDLNSEEKSKPVASFNQGDGPVFSNDSQWLALWINKTPEEIKASQKAAKPGSPAERGRSLHLRRLKDGKTTELKSVLSLRFSDDSRFVAIEIEGNPTPQGPAGSALLIRNLRNGTDNTFGNVSKFAWSDKGSLLAMVVDSPSISNTLQVFEPLKGNLKTLDSSDQDYSSMSWREDAMDLVVMRQMEHGKGEDVSHVLLAWRNLDSIKKRSEKSARVFDHHASADFPADMYIVSGTPAWTKDGRGVSISLREWEEKPKALEKDKADPKKDRKKDEQAAGKKGAEDEVNAADQEAPAKDGDAEAPVKDRQNGKGKATEKEATEKPPASKPLRESLTADSNVEVWHAKDIEIMPLQKKRAEIKDNPRRSAVWWPEKDKLVVLGNELTEDVELLDGGEFAVGLDHTPHERTAMFGPQLNDIYLIDAGDGERKLVLEGIQYQLKSSPDGAWLLYLREGDIWSFQVKTGRQQNLTAGLAAVFTDEEDDSLAKEKPPYGDAQWLADSSAVMLDSRFDVWLVRPDGSASRRLTDGTAEMIRHRISMANFTRADKGLIDPKRPLYLSLYGEQSKKSGYARRSLAEEAKDTPPEVLIWEESSVSSLRRAEENEMVYTFQRESYRDSPDLFLTGPELKPAAALTHTNTFQKEFRWGHSELINYVNDNGVKLQGALIYPANYRKGRKYPMVTYIYERLSQNLHRYSTPSETHPYNPSVFSAEGYFVFMPDIVYRPQEPGLSAVECIVPAVKAVLATGMVDAERVALIGHSWGAYQTAFTVTHSDLFAAGVAGAPLTNMMSMSMQVYWNSGNTNARIFGISQGRMSTPFWRDVDNYIRNSPINGIDNLKTPLLVAFGDKDGAVDFSQGIEMYNAARLANKENYVMLVYPGENHGLRREENMVDYHYRILEWLGHYLKDRQAPKWITDGQSYIERKEELEAKKKAKKETPEKAGPPAR